MTCNNIFNHWEVRDKSKLIYFDTYISGWDTQVQQFSIIVITSNFR